MPLDSDLDSFEPNLALQRTHLRSSDGQLFDTEEVARVERRRPLLEAARRIEERSTEEFRRAEEIAKSHQRHG